MKKQIILIITLLGLYPTLTHTAATSTINIADVQAQLIKKKKNISKYPKKT